MLVVGAGDFMALHYLINQVLKKLVSTSAVSCHGPMHKALRKTCASKAFSFVHIKGGGPLGIFLPFESEKTSAASPLWAQK